MIEDAPLDIVTIDVSFISLKKIIPVAISILKDDGEIVMLIKPQFEAGKEKVGKNGVIKDKSTHIEVINEIIKYCDEQSLLIKGLDFSPIKGPAGNIEFLLYVMKDSRVDSDIEENNNKYDDTYIDKIVTSAHETLDK
jgi:23S rRNA (cytidine1920-2'-O)/16S rRNA (cytidine1409-2'-O)-methyltransferase